MSGLTALSLLVVAALGWFSLRRLVFLIGALVPARRSEEREPAHSVTVVVPAHDEGSVVERSLQALERLEYPPGLLRFVLVSDGSRDGTVMRFRDWASGRQDAEVVELPERGGKGEALKQGLSGVDTELVVVLDADLEPQPDFLRRLVPVFADASVGAAAAFVRPRQAEGSPAARYAAVTAWVHQLVTSAAKDRLSLNPSTHGASCYRREALQQAGGFAAVADPDTAASLAVTRLGWTTRFVPSAIADHSVSGTLRNYWQQHLRWARGALGARPRRTTSSKESLARRVESWGVASGYLDRVVLLAAVALVAVGALPWWTLAAYLALPGLQIIVALGKAGELRHVARYVVAIVLVFVVDVAASVVGLFVHMRGRQVRWESSRAAGTVMHATQREESAAPALACAVLSYQDEAGVVDAVRSLLAQSAAVEIVVVNSGGGDPALRLARAGLDVPVVNAPHRLYPGAARNVGIAQTRARYVSFLAADCLAQERWAEARLRAHRAGADAVASCLAMPNGDGPGAAASLLLLHNRRVPACPRDQRLFYGLSYERALFERYGLFREDLRGGEDTEFNGRLQGRARIEWSDDVQTSHRFPRTMRPFLRELHRRGRLEATVHGKLGDRRPAGVTVAIRASRNMLRALRFSLRFAPGERARFVRAWPFVVCGGIVYAAGALRAYVQPYED